MNKCIATTVLDLCAIESVVVEKGKALRFMFIYSQRNAQVFRLHKRIKRTTERGM